MPEAVGVNLGEPEVLLEGVGVPHAVPSADPVREGVPLTEIESEGAAEAESVGEKGV